MKKEELDKKVFAPPCLCERPVYRRSGSALVIVLGMLSVLLLMAVVFATAMRVERGGATNQKNNTMSRFMLDSALAHTLSDLDWHLQNAGDPPVPQWVVFSSAFANTVSYLPIEPPTGLKDADIRKVSVLTPEMAKSIAPEHWMTVMRAPRSEWLPIFGPGPNVKANIIGRYAYTIINTTGLLDVNLAGTNLYGHGHRLLGTNLNEIYMEPAVFQKRADRGKYHSASEFFRLSRLNGNLTGLTGLPTDPSLNDTGEALPKNLYTAFSYTPPDYGPHVASTTDFTPANSISYNNIYGIRHPKKYIDQKKIRDDAEVQYIADFAKQCNERFAKIFAASSSDTNCWFGRGASDYIPFSKIATVSLLDYIRGDSVSVINNTDIGSAVRTALDINDSSHFPCTTRTPMVDSFLLMGVVTATTNDPDGTITYKFILRNSVVKMRYPNDPLRAEMYDVTVRMQQINDPERIKDKILPGEEGTIYTSDPNPELVVSTNLLFIHNGSSSEVDIVLPTREYTVTAGTNQNNVGFALVFKLIELTVKQNGDTIQKIPSTTYATASNTAFPLVAIFDLTNPEILDNISTNIASGPQLLFGWSLALDPRYGFSPYMWLSGASQACYGLSSMFNQLMGGTIPDSNVLVPLLNRPKRALSENPSVTQSGIKNIYTQYMVSQNFADPDLLLPRASTVGGNTVSFPDHLWFNGFVPDTDMAVKTHISLPDSGDDRPMKSVAEMGTFFISPLRTISLFDMNHPLGGTHTRHRVMDYFTLIPSDASDPTDDFGKLLHGRVNLNPARAPERTLDNRISPATALNTQPNIEPLSHVFMNMPLDSSYRLDTGLPQVLNSITNLFVSIGSNATETSSINAIYDLSALARGNYIYDTLGNLSTYARNNKYVREGFFRNSANLLTTRGQTFTILLRAESTTDLAGPPSPASAVALVEIWRDSEPVRDLDETSTYYGTPTWVAMRNATDWTYVTNASPLNAMSGSCINTNRNTKPISIHPTFIQYYRQFQ